MIMPEHAADCHMHVIGPLHCFPLDPERAYNVPEAALADHERMKARIGLQRTVLVQASGHGFDNRAMLAALAQLGERGRAVAVVPPTAGFEEMKNLDAAGVRGVRLNLVTLASRHGGDRVQAVHEYERLLAPLGWHLQLFADAKTLQALETTLRRCRVDVVVDHMGLPDAAAGVEQPGFQALLRLMKQEHVWAKLAGADRITRSSGRLHDAVPFMRALADVAPERLVWGSDWPHIGFHSGRQVQGDDVLPYRDVDVSALLAVLEEAVPDRAARDAILAHNPARLYSYR
jgi:2-pyrone-4,6-dicarboxylate lactonase